jgi:hypothetical protein
VVPAGLLGRLGALIFAAEWIGGNLRAGLYSLAAMTVSDC